MRPALTDITTDDPDRIGALLDRYAVCRVRGAIAEHLLGDLDDALDDALDASPRMWRPQPSPAGMVDVFHHPAQWQLRQHPATVEVLAAAVGTERVWVSIDRFGYKPARQHGDGSSFLHWDPEPEWVPAARAAGLRAIQGVLYLSDTGPDGGAFWCAPQLTDPAVRHAHLERFPLLDSPGGPLIDGIPDPLRVAGRRGDLVLWDYRLAHGASQNTSDTPRRVAYLAARPAGDEGERAEFADRVTAAAPPSWFAGPHTGEDPFDDWTPLGRRIAGLDPHPA